MTSLDPESRRWLQFAQEDLRTAQVCLAARDIPARQACYFAQQAVEKALKASLLANGTEPPRSHDLDYLRGLLPASWAVHRQFPDLAALTEWLVEARYPGDWPAIQRDDAREAVALASAVLASLQIQLQS